MTNLDLDLINQQGCGETVPSQMDLQMVKYVISERKADVENDPDLINRAPWDQSNVFYRIRTLLNQQGWDTSVYNDNVAGGSDRRKKVYDRIQDVCENNYGVKRHQIGIFPDERASMSFGGITYNVGFKDLAKLMPYGTDVVVVEKQGVMLKMEQFSSKCGVAFIQSQGFVSECGVALAALCNRQPQVAKMYTNNFVPKHSGHLAVLTDCDHSGIAIGVKIPGAYRLGIDVTTIAEINNVNPGLDLKIDDLVEGTKKNSHWKSLLNLANGNGKGKLGENLSDEGRVWYMGYLRRKIKIKGGKVEVLYESKNNWKPLTEDCYVDSEGWQYFIHYLAENRIELNTILNAMEPQKFWNWLKWKLETIWPKRNYNRAITLQQDTLLTPTMREFIEWVESQSEVISKKAIEKKIKELKNVTGFYEDVEIEERKIMKEIVEGIMLHNDQMKKIDLVLKMIMEGTA